MNKVYSSLNLIGKEKMMIKNRDQKKGFLDLVIDGFLQIGEGRPTIEFNVPLDIYTRSISLCEDITISEEINFKIDDLAKILYKDFLEFVRNDNDLHKVHNLLLTRDPSPPVIKNYNEDSEDVKLTIGRSYDISKNYTPISVKCKREDIKRGEYILDDLSNLYPEHNFTLENMMDIIFCDFITEYRRGNIRNPIKTIMKFWEEYSY